MKWKRTDNSDIINKAELRKKYLPPNSKVLDLFSGAGQMFKNAYSGNVQKYHGIDSEKIHDSNLCDVCDNKTWLGKHSISEYNVFDLDDYGSPWKILWFIVGRIGDGQYTIFITDGLVMHQKVDGKVTRFVSATENIPREMNVPGINRFYEEIFLTMLRSMSVKFNLTYSIIAGFHNIKRTAFYWAIKFIKNSKVSFQFRPQALCENKP